jgi:glycosyltransferase involved in cell wall biosynthesis
VLTVGVSRSFVIDARVNGIPGGHGLARSVLGLASQLSEPGEHSTLRVLVNARRRQLFPLDALPAYADVVDTDIAPSAPHRSYELAGLLRAMRAAVLYVPHTSLTPLVLPCPLVVTLHDTTIEKDTGFAGGWLRQQATVAGTRLVLRHAAAVTAPSFASLAEVRARYPRAPYSTLVPNGIDTAAFANVSAAAVARARARYRLPAEFVLAVGAHRPHKNQQVLLHALRCLPERVHLVVVGFFDRNFRDPLPGMIASLGLRERVQLLPEVDDEGLPAVYRAASAFAFPSLSEGYGLPALEALAARVPSAVSDIAVLAEVTGGAALLVAPHDVRGWADALMSLLHDTTLRDRLTTAGHAVAHAATWHRGASVLGPLLSDVAHGRLPRSRQETPSPVS